MSTARTDHTPRVRTSAAPPDTVVVIGGSIAGLLAAAASARHARRVVVLERDHLDTQPHARAGTPQGLQVHGLLASGRLAMEELLPGFTAELMASGAHHDGTDIGRNGYWWIGGGKVADCLIGANGVAASRLLIEATIRRRVRALDNVEVRDGTDVLGLTADHGHRRVTGVRVLARRDGATAEEVRADLVVDASGRAAKAARWFEPFGWTVPDEDRVELGLRYASTHVASRPGDLEGRFFVISSPTPDVPRVGVTILQEDGTWVVGLGGYLDDQPPLDADGFRAFAATLVSPQIASLLADRPLVQAPRPFRFPGCRRRRWERVRDLPGGFVAIGDAICSFDPVFGQGMSVAALEAVALGSHLAQGVDTTFGHRFHAAAASLADRAWDVVVGADLQLPGVVGTPPPGHAVISRYVHRVQQAAQHDPVVATALLTVTNLMAPPTNLLRPSIARRALAPAGRRRRGGEVTADRDVASTTA
jgi:2-polyprenyl-6-methoxyphenol hydroxylase-like FAD-dependent oxidoreductase